MKTFLMIIPFVKMAMLIGLIGFYLFWYIPSMRRIEHRRKEQEQRFNVEQKCYAENDALHNYAAARKCAQDYLDWAANR